MGIGRDSDDASGRRIELAEAKQRKAGYLIYALTQISGRDGKGGGWKFRGGVI